MRLIDADKLRNIIYYGKCDTAYFDIATDREIVKLIDEQPTVNDILCGECEKRIRKDAKEKVLDKAYDMLADELMWVFHIYEEDMYLQIADSIRTTFGQIMRGENG